MWVDREDRLVVRAILLGLVITPLLGVAVLSLQDIQRSEVPQLPDQARLPFEQRAPIAPPRNRTLVVTGHGLGSDRGAISAFAPNGRLLYYNDSRQDYFDVDPSPEGDRTVLYVAAAAYEPTNEGGCGRCERSVIERVNLTTGSVARVYSEVTTMTWHDVDRINETHYLVADTARDTAFIINVSSGLVTWQWRAQSAFSVRSGGKYPEDWTHINDVTWLNGTVMVSVRNQDQIVFVQPNGTLNARRTLGCADCHDVLFEQHNPDYIPATRGGTALLVADSENDRIVEYQWRNGSWIQTWVWSDPRLSWPRDADRLPNGRTLITDTHGQRVFVVNRTGTIVWSMELIHGYDAELLGTGSESAGGWSATALDYESTPATAGTMFAGSVLESLLPPKLRHAIEFIAPWYWSLTDVVLISVSALLVLTWGMIELYWGLGRVRDRLTGRGSR